jgi:hypothetical protein
VATGILIGTETTGSTGLLSGRFHGCKFTASATGTVKEIKVHAGANGDVKVAIYADDAGEPGARLSYNNTGQAVTSGQWNTLTIPELSITKDTVYWLMFNMSVNAAVSRILTGGVTKYKTATYSTFSFPDPAGTGFTNTAYISCIAGWGVLVVSPTGIEQALAYGTPDLLQQQIISPSGIEQIVALGTPTVTLMLQVLSPTGINQVTALGTPKLGFILYPSGISQAIALGTPALITKQFISPSGITQAIVFGTPSLAMFGRICPEGIAQVIAYGTPSMLKYVWHVILDGQYITETPEIN